MSIQRVFVDVDVQRDFCEPDGALYVRGSPNEHYRTLTRFAMQERIPIVGSVDSHAWDAWEFASNDRRGPNGEKPGFPDHCVKGTTGWLKVEGTLPARFRFVPNVPDQALEPMVDELVGGTTQGVYFEKEVYSLFVNPMAERALAALAARLGGRIEFVVYGVATDYCVKAAAQGLLACGFRTVLLTDGVAGITDEGTRATLELLRAKGILLSTVDRILSRYEA